MNDLSLMLHSAFDLSSGCTPTSIAQNARFAFRMLSYVPLPDFQHDHDLL